MREDIRIRPVRRDDAMAWERMRDAFWPSAPGEHAREIATYFRGELREPMEVLLALDPSDQIIGFAELSIRPYAEGCHSGRVAYLEGWYVEPTQRGRGVGAALVQAAEAWGRAQGCSEMGSDTAIDNVRSAAAHISLGFNEVERIVCFRKDL